jgi:hypothetical protein
MARSEREEKAMREYRQFPVGTDTPQRYKEIPVNRRGEPIRKSHEWREMIAAAIAREPDERSPAERAAVRDEVERRG